MEGVLRVCVQRRSHKNNKTKTTRSNTECSSLERLWCVDRVVYRLTHHTPSSSTRAPNISEGCTTRLNELHDKTTNSFLNSLCGHRAVRRGRTGNLKMGLFFLVYNIKVARQTDHQCRWLQIKLTHYHRKKKQADPSWASHSQCRAQYPSANRDWTFTSLAHFLLSGVLYMSFICT